MVSRDCQKLILELKAEINSRLPKWFRKPVVRLTFIPDLEERKGSFALRYLVEFQDGRRSTLRAKIPREEETTLTKAIANQDLAFAAKEEHETLLAMEDVIEKSGDPHLGAIRSLDYLPRWNAFVMQELEAMNFEQLLFDPWMRVGFRNRPRFKLALSGAGRWLKRYHTHLGNPNEVIFSADSIRERYRAKIDQLDRLGNGNMKLDALTQAFIRACENIDGATVTVATQHGDLYFTNVLLSVDDRVAFLDFDPRKQFREPIYFDLSTFIAEFVVQKVKVKSLGFLLPPSYISQGIELFLRGYFEGGEIDRRFLNVYEGIGMVNALYWYQERVKSNQGFSRRIANLFYPSIRDYLYQRAYELFESSL